MPSPRLPIVKALAESLGLEGLAAVEVELVRERRPPDRLIARLARPTTLTPREREIMVLLASGYRKSEIADELGIRLNTVKKLLRNTYAKLNAHTVVEAVNAFLEEQA